MGFNFNFKSFCYENPVSADKFEKALKLFYEDSVNDIDIPTFGNCGLGFNIQPVSNIDRIEFDIAWKNAHNTTKSNIDYDLGLEIKAATKLANGTDLFNMELKTALFGKSSNEQIKFTLDIIHRGINIAPRTFNIVFNTELMEDRCESNGSISTKLLSNNQPAAAIDFVIKGIKSEEQEKIKQGIGKLYDECQKIEFNWNTNAKNLAECAAIAFSLRKYLIDVKLNNFKNDPLINSWLQNYFGGDIETDFQVEFVFPVFNKSQVDGKLKIGAPVQKTKHFQFNSEIFFEIFSISIPINELDERMFSNLDTCVVSHNYLIKPNGMKKQIAMSDKWTPFAESGLHKFSTKKLDANRTAIELIIPDENNVTQTLEIEPTIEGFQIKHNNKVTNLERFNVQKIQSSDSGEYVQMYMQSYPKMLYLIYFNEFEILFDGQTVTYYLLNDYKYDGECENK